MIAPVALEAPHRHAGRRVATLMLQVSLALVPVYGAYVWYFGWLVLVNAVLVAVAAWLCERLAVRLRGAAPTRDYSVVVLALLLNLALPPCLPWWQSLSAAAFAVLIAKHAYGGLGRNLFNPAMAGCAFVLLCFPGLSSLWPPATAGAVDLSEGLRIVFLGQPVADAISAPTPLESVRGQLRLNYMMSELRDPGFGLVAAAGWEVINAVALSTGIVLILLRTISWHIPAALLGGLLLASASCHLANPDLFPSPLFHLFSGATMLAAFFIATDPVSSPANPAAKLAYGALLGLLLFCMRTWGSFPDAVAFAVLVGNALAPLLDVWLKPRVLGT